MTPPTEVDRTADGTPAQTHLDNDVGGTGYRCVAGVDDVRRNMAATGYPESRVHFVKGPVETTIPRQAPADPIALRSTRTGTSPPATELVHLFPRLVEGGILIVDDYGHWEGARKAVDEYLSGLPKTYYLYRIDYTGRLLIEPVSRPDPHRAVKQYCLRRDLWERVPAPTGRGEEGEPVMEKLIIPIAIIALMSFLGYLTQLLKKAADKRQDERDREQARERTQREAVRTGSSDIDRYLRAVDAQRQTHGPTRPADRTRPGADRHPGPQVAAVRRARRRVPRSEDEAVGERPAGRCPTTCRWRGWWNRPRPSPPRPSWRSWPSRCGRRPPRRRCGPSRPPPSPGN